MMLEPLVMDFPPIFMQAGILTLSAIYHEYLYAWDCVGDLMILNMRLRACA